MQTFPITDSAGLMFAVEIENAYIRPRTLGDILRHVEGVSTVTVRRRFSPTSDIHVSFNYHGKRFIVLEPFGDNSRFWLGPDDSEVDRVDVKPIEDALRRHRPSLLLEIVGGILTLRLASILRR